MNLKIFIIIILIVLSTTFFNKLINLEFIKKDFKLYIKSINKLRKNFFKENINLDDKNQLLNMVSKNGIDLIFSLFKFSFTFLFCFLIIFSLDINLSFPLITIISSLPYLSLIKK